MSIRKLLLLLSIIPVSLSAQKYMDNPMVRIAMDTYAAQIAENPDDYMPYYSRAKDYFKYGEKELALADLNKAIELFPRKEEADLSQAYTLRALIYQEKDNFVAALNDFNEALRLDPQSRFSLIGRADLLYKNGDYENAQRDYEILLRQDVRCQEAYLGLARIAYHENNIGLCNDYLEKAQNANPSNPDFYLQRGIFYEASGDLQRAADDYVRVLVFDESNAQALALLNHLASRAYTSVIDAITNCISDVNDKGFFYFLRALVHKNNWHYTASINDWNTILAEKYFYTHSIFYNRAYCYFHLGRFEYALDDINMALSLNGESLPYHILRARLYRIAGEYALAADELAMAATFNPVDVDVLQQSGILAAEQGDYEKALRYYNETIINNADIPYSYILRADAYEKSGDKEAAVNNYELIAATPEAEPTVSSLRGFALAKLGRVSEAEVWIQNILSTSSRTVTGEDYYYAACLYALMGQKATALRYLEEAFKQGYGDYYNIYFENDSPISLEPLRSDPDFRMLVQQYSSIF